MQKANTEQTKQAPHWMDCNCTCHGFHDNTGLGCPHCMPKKYPDYEVAKDIDVTRKPAPQRELPTWENKHNFTLHRCSTVEDVQDFIIECQDAGCIQQVAYSTYHDALTQVCFTCKVVVTNMPKPKGT